MFSSPLNNTTQHEGKKPAEISTVGQQAGDVDLQRVSTLFEEQNSIETLLTEIREIENTQPGPQLDIASLVSLRTVNGLELSQNQLGRGQEQVADLEEENISLSFDLRSNPIEEVLTLF